MRKDSLTEKPQRENRPRVREKSCSHEYAWIETVRRHQQTGDLLELIEYELLDRFYCKYCLEIKEISKKSVVEKRTEMPGWY